VGFERREKAATARIETVFSINPFTTPLNPDRERCACLITAGYLREQRDLDQQMIMIGHQAVGVTDPTVPTDDAG